MEANHRVHAIDGIRGFSLFGILLANLLIFQYGIFGMDHVEFFNLTMIDKGVYHFIKILVEESFLPIFTFLFGYTLIMMRNSFKRQQKRVKWHLIRRSIGILVLGLLHSTFLWEGDILTSYGVMGILLLVFINRKAKTILVWGFVFFGLLMLVAVIDIFDQDDTLQMNENELATYINETNDIYGTGTYAEIKEHRNNSEDPISTKLDDSRMGIALLLLPFMIVPMFLFGMYGAKKGFFTRPETENKYYRIGAFLLLPLGILFKTLGHFQSWDAIVSVSGTILAAGYMACIGLLYSHSQKKRILKPFEGIGKLSLSNYIGQTVICTTIFYGYGLGLFQHLGVALGVLLGVAIFAAEVIASKFYLKYFRYGPLEKLLRVWTNLSLSRKNQDKSLHKVS